MSNTIDWGKIHFSSWSPETNLTGTGGVDSDAQAFITAASITDSTQQSAINTLVTDLKGYGVWTKMKAIYPFVGGTATSHKFNLKDPQDTDAAFRLVFNGGITHSSNGVQFLGVNGWAQTYLNPNTVFTTNDSFHGSIYSRTNTSKDAADYGALNGTTRTSFAIKVLDSNSYTSAHGNFGVITANSDSTGMYVISRTSSTSLKTFKNSLQIGSTYTGANGLRANVNLAIGCLLVGTTPGYYSNRQYAFASIGDGLTDTEASNLYTTVQAFNTTLSRNV